MKVDGERDFKLRTGNLIDCQGSGHPVPGIAGPEHKPTKSKCACGTYPMKSPADKNTIPPASPGSGEIPKKG